MLGEPEGRQAAAVSARRESRKPGLETSDLGAVGYARGQVARSGQQSPVTRKACKSHPLPRSGIARRRMSRRLMLLTVPECLLCPLPGIIFLLASLANSSSPLRGPAQTPLLLFRISTDPSLSMPMIRRPPRAGTGSGSWSPLVLSDVCTPQLRRHTGCPFRAEAASGSPALRQSPAQSWRTEMRGHERNRTPRRGRSLRSQGSSLWQGRCFK